MTEPIRTYKQISVAHSPDSDDYFLFWALAQGKIRSGDYSFTFSQFDTGTLNTLARDAAHDVVAISVGAYLDCAENYLILSSGASVGQNYGPVVVSKKKLSISDLSQVTIGVPGLSTTACHVLCQLIPDATVKEISISPFSLMFEALDRGEIDAAVLIHEGQILYQKHDLELVVDLGKWWTNKYQLPLPLGINVIRRALGHEVIEQVSEILTSSVRYGLAHQEEAIPHLLERAKTQQTGITSPDLIRNYLALYANEDSVELTAPCLRAIEILLSTSEQQFEVTSHLAVPSP